MPTVQCGCGKRMGVSDVLVGKTIRCPQCGEGVLVVAGPASAPKAANKAPREPLQIGGVGALAAIMIVGIGLTVAYRVGPARVASQWDAMGSSVNDQVTDVVTFALQAYLSQNGEYNPNHDRARPAVDGPVNFVVPRMVMSMPEKLKFFGMTNQGKFEGDYNTRTHEIVADIAWGGRTTAGILVLNRAVDDFHITGREIDGPPQAEVDGTSLKIIYPPKEKDDQ